MSYFLSFLIRALLHLLKINNTCKERYSLSHLQITTSPFLSLVRSSRAEGQPNTTWPRQKIRLYQCFMINKLTQLKIHEWRGRLFILVALIAWLTIKQGRFHRPPVQNPDVSQVMGKCLVNAASCST